ncbi:hypothetical protein LTR84_005360 [Exophiala bonariae]|uniref:Piwi domain-containing protein n=1 Tax=Exophiala bonariae TaxID=1690606 RepID=A0AAV9N7R4_9EURO|nr:hypothetical protein LTR84_005360 [Exophiala bonariae]
MAGANARRKKREREQAQPNTTSTNVSGTGVPDPVVPDAPGVPTQPPALPVQDAAPPGTTPHAPQPPHTGFNQYGPPANDTPPHRRPVVPPHGREGGPVPRPQDTHESMRNDLSKLSISNTSSALAANYFPIEIGSINVVYQYDLEISRPESSGSSGKPEKARNLGHAGNAERPPHINASQKARIVWLIMNRLKRENAKVKMAMATNYKTMIITSAEFSESTFPLTLKVPYHDQFHQSPPQTNPTVFNVLIKAPEQLVLSELMNQLSSGQPRGSNPEECDQTLTALNVIFGYRPYQKSFVQQPPTATRQTEILPTYTTVDGGKFYGVVYRTRNDSATGQPLKDRGWERRDGVKSILGFTRSVRPFSGIPGKLHLNVNTTTAMCYPSTGTVAELIQLWAGQQTNLNRSQTSLASQEQVKKNVPTAATWMTPQGHNLVQFFQSQGYGNIVPTGYVVHIGDRKNPTPFPAERLYIIPGQLFKNSIDKPVGAIRLPVNNRQLIMDKGFDLFYGVPNEEGPRAFDLRLEKKMLQVPVRRMGTPQIQYRGSAVQKAKLTTGAWDLKGQRFFITSEKLTDWTYLVINLSNKETCHQDSLFSFGSSLQTALDSYGMRFKLRKSKTPSNHRLTLPFERLPGTRQEDDLAEQLRLIKVKLLELVEQAGVRLAVIVLPSKDQDLYGAIKRAGDVQVGISTVCTVAVRPSKKGNTQPVKGASDALNAPKSSPDFLANLCLKMNLKSGKETVNQALTFKGPILTQRTMIIGIDVTHPGANAMLGAPSIAAVVGSVDSEFAQWPASFGAVYPDPLKESKEEIDNLGDLVYKRIKDYFERNHVQPDKLIIYRDGLSEGQFRMCRETEYPSIQRGLDKVAQEFGFPKPKAILICAVKRHHTRLFPNEDSLKRGLVDDNGNPPPGTMVDESITYGDGDDFFLVSQKAIQGTARPTHYVVLKNDLEEPCSLGAMAQMTHNLCYLFGRATRSVGVCPPAYYADLAADRARIWVRRFYNAPKVDGQRQKYDRAVHDAEFVGGLLAEHQNLKGHMFYI